MKIETKYGFGDTVVPISTYRKSISVPCDVCSGAGVVKLEGIDRTTTCPECYGRRNKTVLGESKWYTIPENTSSIGKIDIEGYAPRFSREDIIRYMIESTGVGSGTLWAEGDLFLTIEEAQEECDRRNSGREDTESSTTQRLQCGNINEL